MGKNVLFYIISFLLLLGILLFFNRAFRQLSVYSGITNRYTTVYDHYQTLGKLMNNAAILTPDLLKRQNSPGVTQMFFADTESVSRHLTGLRNSVKDSIN